MRSLDARQGWAGRSELRSVYQRKDTVTHNTPGPRSGLLLVIIASNSSASSRPQPAVHCSALHCTAHPEDDAEMEEKSLEDDYYLTFDRHAYYTLYL